MLVLKLSGLEGLEGGSLVEVVGKKWRQGKRRKHGNTFTGRK